MVLPPVGAHLDYQLGGGYPNPRVGIVVRDRTDEPSSGHYSICYLNGFQTQPDATDWWRTTHPDLLLGITDTSWDEELLDISSAAKRARIVAVIEPWIADCATKGFDAVEFDNLDSYTRSNGRLTADDAVAMIALLSAAAHRHHLPVAQKNAVELVSRRTEIGTDFVIAEQCGTWDECAGYVAGYGELVWDVEYDAPGLTAACSQLPRWAVVRRDLDLTAAGESTHVFEQCP